MDGSSIPVILMTILEEGAKVVFSLSFVGILLFGSALVLYIFGITVGFFTKGHVFSALAVDPYFNLLVGLIGLFVCLMSITLLFLTVFTEYNNSNSEIVTLFSFIGLGFGAGTVRLAFPLVVSLLLTNL